MPMGKFTIYNLQFTIKIILLLFSLYIVHCTFYITPVHADWALDLNAPTTTISPSCSNCTSGSTSTITITCTDSGGSSCNRSEYSETGSTGSWTTYSGALSRTSNTTIYARGIDNAGNIGPVASQAITFAPTPTFDYSMSNSGNITITPGQIGSNTINMNLLSGTTQSVTLSPTTGPFGSTIAYSVNPCNPTCNPQSNLTVSNTAGVPGGTYPITITGTASGGLQRTTLFNLIVNVPDCNDTPSCSGSCSALVNTCPPNNGTATSCVYTTHSGGSCTQVSAPNQPCSINNCSAGYSCVSGICIAPAWIQTQDGDVHSNTRINVPGGP